MVKKKVRPPSFVGKGAKTRATAGPVIPDELRALGIGLSTVLPTYDVPIDMIEPNDWNPNEMDDPMFDRLVDEMGETGIISAIQIVPSEGDKFRVIGGANRWAGARALGLKTIPCNILLEDRFVDDVDLQKFLTVRLNKLTGETNVKKMIALKTDLARRYGDKQLRLLFGYTKTDAWNKLSTAIEDAIDSTGIKNPKLKKEFRKGAKKAKTVDGLARVLKNLFRKYGSDLRHSFMVFAFGGKSHLYVIADKEMQAALEQIKSICDKKEMDINDVLRPAILAIPGQYEEKKKGKGKE